MHRGMMGTVLLVGLAGCGPALVTDLPNPIPETIDGPKLPPDIYTGFPLQGPAFNELCDPSNDVDRLTRTFCDVSNGVLAPPAQYIQPTGLVDFLTRMGLDFKDPTGENGKGGNPGFAFLGHSSALTARKITQLTPTVFVFTPPVGGVMPLDFAFVGFDPGEHFVEIAANNPSNNNLNLYLLVFHQDCEQQPGGCSNAQLLTPALTKNWTSVDVYEDTGPLANTIAACPVCHDPYNTGNRILRMQEIEPPFTHWMNAKTVGGQALLDDFHAVHGANEDYGPVPASMIDKSDPALMAEAVTLLGFGTQMNAFPSAVDEKEVSGGDPAQPWKNVPPGASPTWQSFYSQAVSGNFIATPYHDVKVTDPQKVSSLADGWRSFMAGQATDAPDLRDAFLDQGLRDMGFAPRLGLSGRGLLRQMCQECHNANLDPTLTRDRFLVDQLDRMSRAEKDLAIQRIQLPLNTRLAMPPPLFRTVTADERAAMISALQQDPANPLPTN